MYVYVINLIPCFRQDFKMGFVFRDNKCLLLSHYDESYKLSRLFFILLKLHVICFFSGISFYFKSGN